MPYQRMDCNDWSVSPDGTVSLWGCSMIDSDQEHEDATVRIKNGYVAIYDWPKDPDDRDLPIFLKPY